MTAPPGLQPGTEVYAAFVDNIDNATVRRIVAGLATAMISKVARVHMLFQSFGGTVGDGVCLYNFFKTLPVPLTLYNTGKVESVATIAFLGAEERKTSAHAAFMIHRTISSPQRATAGALKTVADSVLLDDQRTEAILREHVKFSDDQWRDLDRFDLTLSALQSVECGIAHEVAEWAPPPGTPIFNV